MYYMWSLIDGPILWKHDCQQGVNRDRKNNLVPLWYQLFPTHFNEACWGFSNPCVFRGGPLYARNGQEWATNYYGNASWPIWQRPGFLRIRNQGWVLWTPTTNENRGFLIQNNDKIHVYCLPLLDGDAKAGQRTRAYNLENIWLPSFTISLDVYKKALKTVMSFGQKMAKHHEKQGKPKIEPGFGLTMPKTPNVKHLFDHIDWFQFIFKLQFWVVFPSSKGDNCNRCII